MARSTDGYAFYVRGTITLADGSSHTFVVPARFWKSNLMRKLPYGTDFQGCTFARCAA